MKVYVDGVMGLNFLVDFLLLLGTNRLAGFPTEKKRLLAASALGAVYSGVCLAPEFRFLGNVLWRIVFLGIMAGIAFGWNRSAVPRCGIFLLLSFALGGFAASLGMEDIPGIVAAAVLLWGICRLSFEGPPGSREYLPLKIRHQDRTVNLLALRDTGNTLRDPVTGEQVLVIAPSAACRLTGLTRQQIEKPLETILARPIPGLRLIPFRTVGQGGMMLAMTFDEVTLKGKTVKQLVAFAPENFDQNVSYQALTGGILS